VGRASTLLAASLGLEATGMFGPRRISQDEIRTAFADGWRVDSIEPVMMDNAIRRGAANAWLAAITRT
jgi:hypothetical protein